MVLLSYIAVGIVFLFILYMYVTVLWLRLVAHTKMTYKIWASATVKVALFWGVMLLVETFWWFWPGVLIHQIAMILGGIFCIYWGLIYLSIRSK